MGWEAACYRGWRAGGHLNRLTWEMDSMGDTKDGQGSLAVTIGNISR